MVTYQQALVSLRAQRDALKALDPVPTVLVRRVRRKINEIREDRERADLQEQLAAATDPAEIASLQAQIDALDAEGVDDLREAFITIRDGNTTPASLIEDDWHEDVIYLMQRFNQLAEDDQDPAYIANNDLPRKDRIRNILRSTARSTDPATPESVKSRCWDFLRRESFFGENLNDDPQNVEAEAARTALAAAAITDPSQLDDALDDLIVE